ASGRAAAAGAACRLTSPRLRHQLRAARRRARLLQRSGAAGGVFGRPPAAQKGTEMTVSPELDARFRRAAADEGLLDVAYELHDSPVGRLLVAVTDRGLCEISYDPEPEREEEQLARTF